MSVRRVLSVVVLALACAVVFGGAPAFAKTVRNTVGTFGSFSNVQGIAVDQASGDVYVYDAGASGGTVYKFDSSGKPVSFSALGANAIEGVGTAGSAEEQIAVDSSAGPAKGDIYVANSGAVKIYGADGKALGELNGNVSTEVAGAPWGEPCGVAVGSDGSVYVGLYSSHVNRYTPSAQPAKNTDYASSLSGLSGVCQVGVDAGGSVYADTWASGPVTKYEALQFGAVEAIGSTLSTAGQALASDLSNGRVYVDTGSEVLAYGSGGTLEEQVTSMQAPFSSSHGVAVDDGSGKLYVSDNGNGSVVMLGPPFVQPDVEVTGAQLSGDTATLLGIVHPDGVEAECQFEYTDEATEPITYKAAAPCSTNPVSGSGTVEVSAKITIAPNHSYVYRLVASDANGSSVSQSSGFTTYAPVVSASSAVSVATSTAELEAEVNPMGSDTTVQIEYGTDSSYGSVAPAQPADIGSGGEAVPIKQQLVKLIPGTIYHYRVVASNQYGTVEGPDKAFTTFAASTPPTADTCPNAAYRTGPSAALPDCRAFERVTPNDKGGADVNATNYGEFAAAASGERVQFATRTLFGETHGSGMGGFSQYVATRGPGGWSTKGVDPTVAPDQPTQFGVGNMMVTDFSEELDRALVMAYDLPEFTEPPHGMPNLYLEDTSDTQLLQRITRFEGTEEPVNVFQWGIAPIEGGASADLEVVSFQSLVNLVAPASGGNSKVYAMDHGVLHLVSLLPDGTAPFESTLTRPGRGNASGDTYKDTVSKDGSGILFMARPTSSSEAQLYMRKNESTTVLVSENEGSTPVSEAANVKFQAATPDLEHIVFTTASKLLDTDPGGGGEGLYMYTDSPNPTGESNLTFIARINPEGTASNIEANVVRYVVKGISEDGSHIYFVSGYTADLPSPTESDAMYLWDAGHLEQIAPRPNMPVGSPGPDSEEEALVTPDGQRIVFMSSRALTDNEFELASGFPPITRGQANTMMYMYDEDSNTLRCVSCGHTGSRIVSGVEHTVQATPEANPYFSLSNQPRFFSMSNGRYVFFNTREALVPQDVNNQTDAYEYDAVTGKLSLLSSGTSEYGAWFVEASADGRDAFIVTAQKLVSSDTDKIVDLYDARIGGGFSEPPPTAFPCLGDACQGVPSAAPSFDTASEFKGSGNPPVTKPKQVSKPKRASRAQRLRRALAACRRRAKHRRAACERAARRRNRVNQSGERGRRAGR